MLSSIELAVNAALQPVAKLLSAIVFFKLHLGSASIPVVVLLLVLAALYFTVKFQFINLRGFGQSFKTIRGDYSKPDDPGEITHFEALTAALSGTIGIGNIGGVAIAVSLGGPGVIFWMMVAGFIGMTTKFIECTLSVRFRTENEDGSFSGGPMHYLSQGIHQLGFPRIGKALGYVYAIGIVIGCLGIGNMFQSNQAFIQFEQALGGGAGWGQGAGALFGICLAAIVGLVVIGGIQGIARVTARLVPAMAILYFIITIVVLFTNAHVLPATLTTIVTEAFNPHSIGGGLFGVMAIGFQRAVFSNEAGIGSAGIAHSAVKTRYPATEGLVGMLGPFVDTMVICALTGFVIVSTELAAPGYLQSTGTEGVPMTSAAIARIIPYADQLLAVPALLFAFSTILSWSYYGLQGWIYIAGHSRSGQQGFFLVYCLFVAIGSMMKIDAVLDFSDALVFLICVPNLLGLIVLLPTTQFELTRLFQDYASKPSES